MVPQGKSKLDQYKDPTGEFTNRELKWGEWYLRHKIRLHKITVGVLLTICIITVGFSSWMWVDYLIFGYTDDQNMIVRQTQEFTNYPAIQPLYGAQDLQIDRLQVYRSGPKSYDFVGRVVNPNERWSATVTYHFAIGNTNTESVTTVVLPGADRPLGLFGYESDVFPSGARLMIDKTEWKRINPHTLPDIAGHMRERLLFSIDNFAYTQPGSSGNTALTPRLTFDLYNDSAFSYWQPVFFAELLNGGQTVGVMYLAVDQLKAGEKRAIDLGYSGDPVSVTDIRLHPIVDVFDPEVYIQPGE